MHTYGNCLCPITPDRVHPYVDVVGVWLDHAPSAPDRAAFDCRIRVQGPRPHHHRFRRCWLIFFYQPDAATLAAIAERNWPLCYVELALDWIILDPAAHAEAATFFHRHFVHPRSGDVRISGHSRYTRSRKSRINVASYSDRPSKVTGEQCLHVECRMRGRSTLRDHHISSAADLINYDHRGLWRELLRFYDLDVERFGRHVNNRQTNDGRVRTTPFRRRTPLIYPSGNFTYDQDRQAGWVHLRHSGSIQQLLADLRNTTFAVPRRYLIPIPVPDCLLPAHTDFYGYTHTRGSVPVTPCHHTKHSELTIADAL
jgi:hypothetical protein